MPRSVKGLICEFLQVAAHLCLVQTGDFSSGKELKHWKLFESLESSLGSFNRKGRGQAFETEACKNERHKANSVHRAKQTKSLGSITPVLQTANFFNPRHTKIMMQRHSFAPKHVCLCADKLL